MPLRLWVKVREACILDLQVEASTSILELKHVIAGLCNVPAAQQRLLFAGQILEDDASTLSSYQVTKESTLTLVQGVAPSNGSPASPTISTPLKNHADSWRCDEDRPRSGADHVATHFEAPSYSASAYTASEYTASKHKAADFKAASYSASEFKATDYKASSYSAAPVCAPPITAPTYQAPSYKATAWEATDYEAPRYEAATYKATNYDAPKYQVASRTACGNSNKESGCNT